MWDTRLPGHMVYIAAFILFICTVQQPGCDARGTRKNHGGTRDRGERNNLEPKFKDTKQNITVGPGDRAVLKCRVENLGTKTISWHRADLTAPLTIGLFPFTPNDRISVDYNQRFSEWSLIIQDARPEDEGTYQCIISSKEHSTPTYEIKLNVKTVHVTGTTYIDQGKSLELVCNATGKPHPPRDVKWYKNGNPIDSDANQGILITKKIETRVLISVLVIKHSKMGDSGDYICRSSNGDAGSVSIHVLNVSGPKDKRESAMFRHGDQGTSAGVSKPNGQASSYRVSRALVLPACLLVITYNWTMDYITCRLHV